MVFQKVFCAYIVRVLVLCLLLFLIFMRAPTWEFIFFGIEIRVNHRSLGVYLFDYLVECDAVFLLQICINLLFGFLRNFSVLAILDLGDNEIDNIEKNDPNNAVKE